MGRLVAGLACLFLVLFCASYRVSFAVTRRFLGG